MSEQPLVSARPGLTQLRKLMPDPPPPEVKKVEPPKMVLVPTIPDAMVREQLGAAVDSLQQQSEMLAEQSRGEGLELAYQIARRIAGVEMKQNPMPLFGMVRESLVELAEARRITLRVCAQDAAALTAARRPSRGLSMAKIELAADPSLKPGECRIESDLGQLAGRRADRDAQRTQQLPDVAEGAA